MTLANQTEPFVIAGHTVTPGQRRRISLPVAALPTDTPLDMTLEVLHGVRPGPVLLICGAIHGDELNGVAIVRRLLATIDPATLSGTLLLVPVVNVFGFLQQSRYLPDRRDLNRSFPGSAKGSMAARLAKLFFAQVVTRATHIVDLHTASSHRDNLPQVRAALDQPGVRDMAAGFGAPVILDSALVEKTLRSEAGKLGIPTITYEAGEALRLDERAIELGVQGVFGVMQTLALTKTMAKTMTPTPRTPTDTCIVASSRWLRAPTDGLFRPLVKLGEQVVANTAVAEIAAPLGSDETQLLAPCDGIVLCLSHLPLVHAGEAVLRIASFDQIERAAQQVAARLRAGERMPER